MKIQDVIANELETMASLIEPQGSNHFFSHYWGEKSVHIPRTKPDYFSNLFSIKHLDHIIGYSMTRDHVFFIKEGVAETISEEKRPSLAEVYAQFSKGWPLLIRGIHLQWPALGAMNSALAEELGFKVRTDVRILPPSAESQCSNATRVDTLFLQIAGEIGWELETPGQESQAPQVKAGDTLYVPKGTRVKQTILGDGLAAFLEIHIFAKTNRDLLVMAIELLAEKEIPFRKGLPLGSPLCPGGEAEMGAYLQKVLIPKLKGLDWEAAKAALAFKVKEELTPLPDGHFLQMRHVDDIHLDTVVERRPGATGAMRFFESNVELQFPGHYQHGPDKMFLAMDFVIETKKFQVKDIPGWYSDKEKLLWVKHLVRKGYLRILENKLKTVKAPIYKPKPIEDHDGTFYRSHDDFTSLFDNILKGFSEKQKNTWYNRVFHNHLIFSELLANQKIIPKGVVYLGANVGQLLYYWISMRFSKLVMVEPQPEKFATLEKVTDYARRLLQARGAFTGSEMVPELHAVQGAVDREDGVAKLNVMSNSTLSSLLPPNEDLIQDATKHILPNIHLAESIEVPAFRLDTILTSLPNTTLTDFNVLYMNIQGAELRALQGAEAALKHLEFIVLEVNYTERYFGLPSEQAITEYLTPFGFTPVWGRKGKDHGFIAYRRK